VNTVVLFHQIYVGLITLILCCIFETVYKKQDGFAALTQKSAATAMFVYMWNHD